MRNTIGNNIKKQMLKHDKSRKQMAQELNVPYTTLTDWINGNRIPRMDKIEMMANYFGCLKSELIEGYVDESDSDKILIEAYNRADSETQAMVRRLLAYSERLQK